MYSQGVHHSLLSNFPTCNLFPQPPSVIFHHLLTSINSLSEPTSILDPPLPFYLSSYPCQRLCCQTCPIHFSSLSFTLALSPTILILSKSITIALLATSCIFSSAPNVFYVGDTRNSFVH